MADITDPTATAYVNEKIRPMANNLAQLYNMAKAVIDEYTARGGTSFISNGVNDIVQDGADTDSRPVVTGRIVTEFGLVLINDIITMLEANNNEKLNQVLAIANKTFSIQGLGEDNR